MSLIKPSKVTKFDFSGAKLVKKITLQCTDIVDNHHKFYIIELYENQSKHVLKTKYGRTGGKEITEYREWNSVYRLEEEIQWLIKNKTKKGYREIETQDIVKELPKNVNIINSSLPVQVVNFINDMFGMTTTYIQENVKTPLGNLSQNQIDKGKELLKQIEGYIKKINIDIGKGFIGKPHKSGMVLDLGSKEELTNSAQYKPLIEMCNEYYSNIPQQFSHRISLYDSLITTKEHIAKQEEVLQALQDIVGLKNSGISIDESLENKYKSMGINIALPTMEENDYIVDWFSKSKSKAHKVNEKIIDILKIERPIENTTYNNSLAKMKSKDVFHGTRNENVLGICTRGMLLPGQHSGAITGAMFGRGIYGAIHSTKSMQYCGMGWRQSSNKNYMFVMDMALGKTMEVNSTTEYRKNAKLIGKKYDSVWAKAGREIVHDELIVYSTAQCKINYIIKFKQDWN
jgi:poly [ADP-ribose] polymerase